MNDRMYIIPVVIIVLSVSTLLFPGCFSSRTLMNDLAKTPHHPVQDTAGYTSLNSYQQDFLYLTEMVRESHPEPYAAWSKKRFDTTQQRFLISLGTDTGSAALENAIDSFLRHIRDSHTSALTSGTFDKNQYPVSFSWIKDTLILASVAREQDTALIGSRILEFNGIPAHEVFERFTQFTASENVYQARRVIQYYFVFPSLQRKAMIIHADTLELNLRVRDGSTQAYRIVPTESPKRVSHYDSHPITKRSDRPYKYTILKKEKACYFQWNAMIDLRMTKLLSFPTNLLAYPFAWYMGLRYFDHFLKDMFEEMDEEGVSTLIVDLRGNGGGNSVFGDMLLYHLNVPTDIRDFSMAIKFSRLYKQFFPENYEIYAAGYSEKFNGRQLPDSLIVTTDIIQEDTMHRGYFRNLTDKTSDYYTESPRNIFKGKTYFLVGDGTYSSAIILSTLVKDNKLFTVVGQPARGRPSHYGETLFLKLPNTGILCHISCKKFFRPNIEKDAEDSLYPDVEIWPTFNDNKFGRDPVFDWVLEDAKTNPAPMK